MQCKQDKTGKNLVKTQNILSEMSKKLVIYCESCIVEPWSQFRLHDRNANVFI